MTYAPLSQQTLQGKVLNIIMTGQHFFMERTYVLEHSRTPNYERKEPKSLAITHHQFSTSIRSSMCSSLESPRQLLLHRDFYCGTVLATKTRATLNQSNSAGCQCVLWKCMAVQIYAFSFSGNHNAFCEKPEPNINPSSSSFHRNQKGQSIYS